MMIHQPDPQLYAAAAAGTGYIQHHRGILHASGADRLDLLHRLSTNTLTDLKPGEERTTVLTTEKGRIVDLVRVVVAEDGILMVLAGSEGDRVRRWLDKYTIMDDFVCRDVTGEWGLFGVYGETSRSLLSKALECQPADAGTHVSFQTHSGAGFLMRDARINGAAGFLLVVPSADIGRVAARLESAGMTHIDQTLYHALRIEAGVPAAAAELNDHYNPLEAGISQYVSWTKGCYIGQEVIARLDTYDKVQRHLVGLLFSEAPETSDPGAVIDVINPAAGEKIGSVTSMARRPGSGEAIGLAYVRTEYAVPGMDVLAGGVRATIAQLPIDP